MKYTLLPAALLILAGCSTAPPPVVDNRAADARAIEAVEETALKGWAARNAEQIASAYSPDASLILPNTPTVKGADMKTFLQGMLVDKNLSLKFTNIKTDVAKSGDLGYTQGTYVMTMTDPKTKKVVTENGRYVTLFAKAADGWKIVSDVPVPDAPAMAAPSAKSAGPAKGKSKAKKSAPKKKR